MITKVSDFLFRTFREDPATTESRGYGFLLRAGYIRQTGSGIFSWMPLGLKVRHKIENIIRYEMRQVNAIEVLFPALFSADLFKQSGRWSEYGDDIFRLKDRRQGDYLLAPTHEEAFTQMMKEICTSYRDLPRTVYQIQDKYRDELRPRAGLLRSREFSMKDAYSFDLDEKGLRQSYEAQKRAYKKIFDRLEIDYVIVKANAGAMGGSVSEEFLHPTEMGDDTFVVTADGSAFNAEVYVTLPGPAIDYSNAPEAEDCETPGVISIPDLVNHMNSSGRFIGRVIESSDCLKCLLFRIEYAEVQNGNPGNLVVKKILERGFEYIGFLVPGDRNVDLKRAQVALSPLTIEPADNRVFECNPSFVRGSIGPGLSGVFYCADPRVSSGSSWIIGANRPGVHRIGAIAGRDFSFDCTLDVSSIKTGDKSEWGPVTVKRGIEIGHLFQLGLKYSNALGLKVLDKDGYNKAVFMGSYGIGVSRLFALIAEKNCDERGLKWPAVLAPFDLHVVLLSSARAELIDSLTDCGLDVLVDDRRVSPGVKFTDAQLIGVPKIIVIGDKTRGEDVEVWDRANDQRTVLPLKEMIQGVIQRSDTGGCTERCTGVCPTR
ncbi:proline--tRNA ligase [Tropheryma whipplei]|uniref:Proline--tRNA ligase n=1 Tax=Tropheryma whipplei (strain TW08/27) TaxID=218496 RepID=SYP_TROW8|nr:proline--tRNA ligase [Tropheryma whipplei]Q83HI1.1 RecName: Full=Proline--tRNA ligase; AltName: Full=Prolyl-tRNA synthetase; Short=ProRS [Tropheryma whipplei TW08/27]CAD67254.1 prolyl-tRNA synthetase [Tropheryma whipplei TW08/27]